MKKEMLTSEVSKSLGISGRKASAAVNSVFNHIAKSLHKGESVCITGFGTFNPRMKKRCTILNINDGKKLKVGDRKIVTFSQGEQLKKAVRSRKITKLFTVGK